MSIIDQTQPVKAQKGDQCQLKHTEHVSEG
jgi:hypothetical protein